jgi:hypothetical protein
MIYGRKPEEPATPVPPPSPTPSPAPATPELNHVPGTGDFSGFARIGKKPSECIYARARARGWNDVRDGKGFRDAYDTWGRKQQFAYERGRFQATLAKRFLLPGTGKLSIWNRDETLLDGPLTRSCGHQQALAIDLETRLARKRIEKAKDK